MALLQVFCGRNVGKIRIFGVFEEQENSNFVSRNRYDQLSRVCPVPNRKRISDTLWGATHLFPFWKLVLRESSLVTDTYFNRLTERRMKWCPPLQIGLCRQPSSTTPNFRRKISAFERFSLLFYSFKRRIMRNRSKKFWLHTWRLPEDMLLCRFPGFLFPFLRNVANDNF